MHRRRPSATRRSFFNACEPLEARRLLAASLNGGVLQINGTSSADTITVGLTSGNLVVTTNGTAQSFAASSVTQINASLGNGDDTISLGDGVDVPSTIDGGDGSDTLSYATSTAAVTGGVDATSMSGSPATITGTARTSAYDVATLTAIETLAGGSGADTLSAFSDGRYFSPENPLVSLEIDGGGGNDTLSPDTYYDSFAPLTANGGEGNDTISFVGHIGEVFGGDGDDTFNGDTDSYATIEAGTGVDQFDYLNDAAFDYTMPIDLENLTVEGLGTADVVGNDLNNVISIVNGDVDGGGGNDTIDFSARSTPVTGSLNAAFSNGATFGDVDVSITGSATVGSTTIGLTNVETIVGGSGDDTLHLSASTTSLVGTQPTVTLKAFGGGGNDALTISGTNDGSGSVDVYSTATNFVADGGAGDDSLSYADITAGQLIGGAGDDSFRQSTDDSLTSISPGDGFDTYTLTNQPGVVYTMPADLEHLIVTVANATITGSDNDDLIEAVGGTVNAGGGNDHVIVTGAGGATVNGGEGDDTLTGGDGGDVLDGGDGNNHLDGGAGNDTLSAGSGNDAIYGGAGDDSIHGDAGNDTLYGQDGRDKLWGGSGDDRVDGGNGNDVLRGEDGDDKVYGRDGNDSVSGGEGRDSVYGDAGNDHLNGDGGRDILYGGSGIDAAPKQSIDRIYKEIELLA